MEGGALPEVSTASPRHQLIADIVRAQFVQYTDSQTTAGRSIGHVFSKCARNFPKEWPPEILILRAGSHNVSFLYRYMLRSKSFIKK
jgi:hypothetical protein